MTKNLLLILFSICFSALTAQQAVLKGKVIDRKTNEGLFGATILVPATKAGTATNFDGNFEIKADAGNVVFEITYLGYKKQTINLKLEAGKTYNEIIRMDQEGINLGVVVVTASQFEKSVAEETVSMDVLDKKLVENSNSRDLGEAVAKTPGVQVQDGQISIRGGSSYSYGIGSRTAVLVDGNTLQTAGLQDADLKFAPMENIEQIEVIKGSSSVVYGSSALSGVINIRTAWAKDTIPETEITTYFGAFANPRHSQLVWWNAHQPNFAGMFINHKKKVNEYVSYVVGGNIDNISSYLQEASEFRSRMNAKIKIRSKKYEGLTYGTGVNTMWESSDRFIIGQGMGDDAYQSAFSTTDRYIRNAIAPFLIYSTHSGHKFRFDGQYFNRWRKGNGDDINSSENGFSFHPQYQYTWQREKVRLIGTTGLPLNYGFSKSNLFPEAGFVTQTNVATYAQAEMKYQDLSIVGGVRYEYVTQMEAISAGFPVFRGGLNYKAGKASYLRYSWGQGFRVPSIAETRVTGELINGVFIFPNNELQTEKSWNMELGLKQGMKIKEWVGYVDFAFFWQEFPENLIEYRLGLHSIIDPYTQQPYPHITPLFPGIPIAAGLKPFNVEKARVAGYELSVGGKGQIGPVEIRTLMGYTYTLPANLNDSDVQESISNPENQPGDENLRKAGNYMADFFKYMFKRIEGDDVNKLLQFRSRHIAIADIEFNYKKLSVGYSWQYFSFPERVPNLYLALFGVLEGSLGQNELLAPFEQLPELARERNVSLVNYIDRHQKGDLVMNARIGFDATERFRVSVIAKNITNKIYSVRPGRLEAPLNFTLQLKVKF
jgi:outer membrane receptor protein involved in Fe transport